MNAARRLDWIFFIGHGIALLGLTARALAPSWFSASLFQTVYFLFGLSVFSVFFLWAVLRLARMEMDNRPRLLWLAALLLAAPVTLPLAYVRFLRPTLAPTA